MLTIQPLHALYAAEVIGLDLNAAPAAGMLAQIDEAFAKYRVLVFRDQRVSDAGQIAFSKHFGALETTKAGTPCANGTETRRMVPTTIADDAPTTGCTAA